MPKHRYKKTTLTGLSYSALLLLVLTLSSASVYAQSNNVQKRPLTERVDRLERLINSQQQLDFLNRLKMLQQENQSLRSQLEEQANEIRMLKQQQRELYQDINRRMGQGASMVQAQPGSERLQEVTPVVEVVDKSTTRPSRYDATEREEILVKQPEPEVEQQVKVKEKIEAKPAVAIRKPMTAKERQAEQKAYQAAYNELRARRYEAARDAFIQFIQQFPYGRYAHIAQYWVAESSYAQRNYEQAIKDYQRLVDVYPFSPKKAEAELKKAYSYFELGKKAETRRTLQQLLANYPNTTEAGQARRLLKKL